MKKESNGFNLEKIKKCFKIFSYGFSFAMFYTLFVVASPWLETGIPLTVLSVFWTVSKLILAYALICYFNESRESKIAFAGIFMFASAIFTIFPISGFLSLIFEALALTGISLFLFDLNKQFPALRLSVASGLIFLGVIFSILANQMMLSIAGFAWLFGFLVAAQRINILTKLKKVT